MRDRTDAQRNSYDCNGYHLLCDAVRERTRYTAQGFDCFIFSETITKMQFTVYYMAHKRLDQQTRKERGCYV